MANIPLVETVQLQQSLLYLDLPRPHLLSLQPACARYAEAFLGWLWKPLSRAPRSLWMRVTPRHTLPAGENLVRTEGAAVVATALCAPVTPARVVWLYRTRRTG